MIVGGHTIQGVIFDADGTLIDSMPIWDNVGNEYLLRRNIIPKENLAETFQTMSLEESAAYYQEHYGIKETSQEIIEGILDLIREAYEETIARKEGVKEFLDQLDQLGIPMCIATATDRHLIEAVLRRTGLDGYFKEIVTCSQVGYSKEYPAVYDVARRHLMTKKENTLVVEDAVHAARTAKAAGYLVLGIYDASESKQQELKELTDVYLPSWNEVRGIGL